MDFVSIDVETANSDMASICQIGLVKYESGILSDEWMTYIDPRDYFDVFNVSIHGIDKSIVKGAPSFLEISDSLLSFIENYVVVSHTCFDRVALGQAAKRYNLNIPDLTWLDSSRVARRTWKECAKKGYGLKKVCKTIGYEFKHHDALEDAKAAARILLAASEIMGFDINGWLKRVQQPIDPTVSNTIYEANPEGPFFGEVLVFTGALEAPRREASSLAARLGYQVAPGVTGKTTILVVGDNDIKKLAGHKKSSKHRKAEDLIRKGVPIKIVQESDFMKLADI